jgi:hypothetical protein
MCEKTTEILHNNNNNDSVHSAGEESDQCGVPTRENGLYGMRVNLGLLLGFRRFFSLG